MNALKCELCGSNDILKTDGYYVCQHCGTKYSVEEAKKMALDLNIEINGSVSIDNSQLSLKYLSNARLARASSCWEQVEKYYCLVEQIDPSNFEAAFYSSFARIRISLEKQNLFEMSKAFDDFKQRLSMVSKLISDNDVEQQQEVINGFCEEIKNLANIVKISKLCGDRSAFANERAQCIGQLLEFSVFFINWLIYKKDIMYLHTQIVEIYDKDISITESKEVENSLKKKLLAEHNKIKEIDPNHVIPEIKIDEENSGCYIATAVYGSYDCPQVWVLRRYRDSILSKTLQGKAFIRIYYFLSPAFVNSFGSTTIFQKCFRKILDNKVKVLLRKGVKDSPYFD